tara:strand:+ start:296 stop:823 length:528 start_codon:yes stop_codon:yes gene_type:complete
MPTKEEKKEYDRLRYIEKREEKLQQVKDYYNTNKEKIIEYQKKWTKDNPDKKKVYQKKAYDKDPEKFRLRSEKWAKENPEKLKAYLESDLYKKQSKIARWKNLGIICDNWENIHRIYMATNKCEFCLEPFKNSLDRNLDHNHTILDSYNIRGILCRVCNTTDKLKDYPIKEYPLD